MINVNVNLLEMKQLSSVEFFIQCAAFEIESLFSLVNLSPFDILTVLYKIFYQRKYYR
jgi:hypothetical protein